MLDASAEADPERQAAVRRFVAGSFHPYMTALPKMMVREELEAVYPGCAACTRTSPTRSYWSAPARSRPS